MGRRREAATVDSSLSSAETSFRVLDDVLLQKKAKSWLSQVLKRRLEDDVHISDLLADGEMLFEVSKLLWDMLLVKFTDIRNVKASLSRRRGGRYMPYSNVDSFLKVCKVLGLNGIDLFSPSDVVEKRDIRKVCICIRALSKKARSQHLNVPDFDGVSHAAAMPKNMVGYIRRSLETPQCSSSTYSSQCSCKVKRSKSMQKRWISDNDENSDSDSDKSDEAESKYLALETETNSGDPQSLPFSDSVLGPDDSIPTLLDEEETMWAFLRSIDCDQSESNQITFNNSYDGKHLEDMDDVEVSSTMSMNSIVGRVLNMDFDDSFDIGECSTVTGRSSELLEYDRSSLGNNQPHDFPYSDTFSNCSDADDAKESHSDLILEHEEFCLELLSSYENRGQPSTTESEMLQHGSYVNPGDVKMEILGNEEEIEEQVPGHLVSGLHPTDFVQTSNGDMTTSSLPYEILVESVIACTESLVVGGQSCPDPEDIIIQDTSYKTYGIMPSNSNQDVRSLENHMERDFLVEKPPNSSAEASVDTIEVFGVAFDDSPNDTDLHPIEGKSDMDGRDHEHPETSAENIMVGIKNPQINKPQEAKPHKRRVLKNVAKGTALIGVLCFLLHISRRGEEKIEKVAAKQSRGTLKSGTGKPSLREEPKAARGNGAYPAENLKFGK